MAKSTTRCQCGSTSNRICCSRADFHKPVPSARINPISRSCTPFITDTTRQHTLEGCAAAFWLCSARRELRLGLLAGEAPAIHAPAGEAREPILLPQRRAETRCFVEHLCRILPLACALCFSSPRRALGSSEGLRSCSTVSDRGAARAKHRITWITGFRKGAFYKIHPSSCLFIRPSPAVQATAALTSAAQDLSWPGPRRCCQTSLSGQRPWESHSGLSLEFQVGTFLTQAKNKCEWGSILWICWAANYILKLKSETRFANWISITANP